MVARSRRVSFALIEKIKRAAHAAQHAEAEHIDLHEFQRVDIVLVPFDDLAIIHRCRLDRHQLIKPIERQHKTAGMLREMPRRADQLLGELERQPEPAIFNIEVEFLGFFLRRPRCSSPRSSGQRARDIFRQAKRLADFAHGAAGSVARDDGRQGRPRAAVGLVNPLNDFFTPLMLEIDINIRRLAALLADETLEQQALANRINRSDAENVTDRRIGGRAAALAKDVFRARKTDDGFDGQEIGRILHALDQIELMPQLRRDIVGQAFGIALRGAFPGQLFKPFLRVEAVFKLFGRIGVCQLIEREFAALGNLPVRRTACSYLGKSRSISSGVFRKRSACRSF